MATWQIVPLMVLLSAVAPSMPHESRVKRGIVSDFYDDFVDPYQIDNSFHVDCGNSTHMKMRVVFRGDARKIFSTGANDCEFVQTETGHYVVEDAQNDPKCPVTQAAGLELYTLDVTVQKKMVHFDSDPRYLISCNYELGGVGKSQSQAVDNEWVEKTPHLVQANSTAQSTVTLSLRDTKNEDVTSVKIGEFVQLVSFMTPQAGETSFRIWNCMASSNDTGVYVEHAILIEGCGDANVIRSGRGFRSSALQSDQGSPMVVARSVFFRAFALLNNPSVQFACDYIVRMDTSALGPSCDASREALAGRKKRSIDALARTKRQTSAMGLPQVLTDVIELRDPDVAEDNVVTYAINKNTRNFKNNRLDLPSIFYKNSVIGHRQRNLHPRRQDTEPEVVSILTQPLVIGLLVTCAILIMVPMMIACGIFVTRTRSVRYVKPRYASPPPIYMPDSPAMVEKLDVRLVR